MALNIKDPEADRLARALAASTGETLTEAVLNALKERLARQSQRRPMPRGAKEILGDAQHRLKRARTYDTRPADQILGYDKRGLPH